MLSYLSLLFFGTLHSNGYIFPFLLCFSLLFFSRLFVRPPQTAILPFCISFSWDGLDPCLLYNVTSIVHQALCPSDLIPAWRILIYQNQYWDIELWDVKNNNNSIINVHGTNYMLSIALCVSNKSILKIPKMYVKALPPVLSRFPY